MDDDRKKIYLIQGNDGGDGGGESLSLPLALVRVQQKVYRAAVYRRRCNGAG